MVAFLISSLLAGFVVVFVLPFVKTQVDRVPGLSAVTSNRFIQLLIVGAIVLLGISLFGQLAKRIKL